MRLPSGVTQDMQPYRPYGTARDVMLSRAGELAYTGPAGTGKSRTVFEKIHLCCEKYAGCRWLVIRKTRESLTESGLVTYEDKVVPKGHPVLTAVQRKLRQAYNYPNGSSIVIAGLDKPGKIMSTEFDGAYAQEGTEITENDAEMVTSRLRNGIMPYQPFILDCNPDTPFHWIRERIKRGQMTEIVSRHSDNPLFWDHLSNDWTPLGRSYVIGKLSKLTGNRLHRLYEGKWVSSEGIVYTGFDRQIHVVPRFPIPVSWRRFWVFDFGYRDPFVWQAWAVSPEGRLYRYREIYYSRRLVSEHAKRILTLTQNDPKPFKLICDHDAEGRATLEKEFGIVTHPAKKGISDGIQALSNRLLPDFDGKPTIYYLENSLDQVDPDLANEKKPTSTIEEFDGYIWDTRDGRKKGEQPLDKDNHGMDTSRYMVAEFDVTEKQKIQVGKLQAW